MEEKEGQAENYTPYSLNTRILEAPWCFKL